MAINPVRAAFTLRADNIGTGATVSSGANFTAGSDVAVGFGLYASTPGGYISAVTVNGVAAVQVGGENAGNLPSGNGSSGIWLANNVPGGGPNVVFTITGSAAGNYIYGGGLEATYISATVVATLTTADATGQTTPTFNITSPSAQIGALVAFANHCGNQGYTTAGTGQTMWFNSSTDTSGEEAAGVYKFATASGDQSITLDKITSANGNYTMVVLAEGTGPGQAASPSRKGRITHPGKRGPLLLTHFRRGFRPNTATSAVTVALTGVAGTGAVGNAAPTTSKALTGNAATSAVGTAVPATSIGVTGNQATSAVGTLGAQAAVPVGSRRRSMGTSPRVTPYNLRKFYKTARNAVVAVSPDVTVALTGVPATSAVGTLGVTHTQAQTGNAAAAAVGTLAPVNSQPITGSASTAAIGTLAPALSVALTGNAASGAPGSVSVSGTGAAALTGVAATGSPGSLVASTSLTDTGVAGTGSAGTVGNSRTIALSGNAASAAVGNVAAGNDIIVAISGVAASSAAGSVVQSRTISLPSVSATGSAGRLDVLTAYTANSTQRIGRKSYPGTGMRND